MDIRIIIDSVNVAGCNYFVGNNMCNAFADGQCEGHICNYKKIKQHLPLTLPSPTRGEGKKNKVAILGKVGTKFKAPFEDESWDIWSMNIHSDAAKLPRVDLWFDIHANEPNPNADIKRANYPFKEAENLLGGQYFNNTVSYMIAYAILKGYKEIALYGMKFNDDKASRRSEYKNVRELIFFAKGRGIKITAPEDKIMLQEYELYGV